MTLGNTGRVDIDIDGRCISESLDVIGLRLDRTFGDSGCCLNIEMSQGLVGNVIRGTEGTACTNHVVGDVHRLLGGLILVLINADGEGGKHDGLGLIGTEGTATRQSLPELLGNKRHHRVKQSQTSLEGNPESSLSSPSAVGVGLALILDDGLDQFKIDVAKVINPQLIRCLLGITELVVLEVRLNRINSVHELGNHELVSDGHLSAGHKLIQQIGSWLEVRDELKSEAGGIPKLVAEHSITNDALDIEVDVTALNGVCEQSESEGIGSTFGDTVGEVGSLVLLGLGNFLCWKVTGVQLT